MPYTTQISKDIEQHRRVLKHSEELANCPRCGGEPVADYALGHFRTPTVTAYCRKCGAHTRKVASLCSVLRKGEPWHIVTESEAVAQVAAMWNRRAVI